MENQTEKPKQLRIIFILNALMMVLPFVFFGVATLKGLSSLKGVETILMVYTGIAYIISFAVLVSFILKKNIIGFRIMFVINVLIAFPAKAFLGIIVAIVSIILSFNSKVISYAAQAPESENWLFHQCNDRFEIVQESDDYLTMSSILPVSEKYFCKGFVKVWPTLNS